MWLSLGLVLEAMHGFKLGWYLDVVNDARRLMLTLAHAHGTLIALVNLAFAATMRAGEASASLARGASFLRWAGILMPVGFLLGGIQILGADPGFGIVLVPVGAVFLCLGVLAAARAAACGDHLAKPSAGKGDETKPPLVPR